jgi:hypothetical protein
MLVISILSAVTISNHNLQLAVAFLLDEIIHQTALDTCGMYLNPAKSCACFQLDRKKKKLHS